MNWAFAFSSYGSWLYGEGVHSLNAAPNAGTEVADMNIWAYRESGETPIPEPSSLALMAAGLGTLALTRRR